ncbi:MAG TPA: hypothetical protein VF723_14025 [Pyrinomonadaceae bacterium]|jgi:hypothetical protein
MAKGKLLAMVGGVLLAALMSFVPSTGAACNGNCDDTYEGRRFKVCKVILDAESGEVLAVECYYGAPE